MSLGSHISDTDKRPSPFQFAASVVATALVATLASATLGDVLLARCSGSCLPRPDVCPLPSLSREGQGVGLSIVSDTMAIVRICLSDFSSDNSYKPELLR